MEQGGGFERGFTIVETMIFLAISAALAVSALLLISGRQNKTEFQTAANDLQQKIQQIVNETTSGFYPDMGKFKCTAAPGNPATFVSTFSAPGQGTNNDCVFVGKALRFGDSAGSTLKTDQFTVYPLAANRLDSNSDEVTCYVQNPVTPACPTGAFITAVAQNSTHQSGPPNPYPNDTTITSLQNGLSFSWVKYNGGAQVNGFALFGFLTSLASYSSGLLSSGSQQLLLYGFPAGSIALGGASTQNTLGVADALDQNSPQPYQTVTLCFNSATTHQSAELDIGESAHSNGGLGVDLQIHTATLDCT